MSTQALSITAHIKVMITDDHSIMRAGLRMLLETDSAFYVIGEAGNSRDAIAIASDTQPDIILLDLDLGGEKGLELIPKLLEVSHSSRIIILTGLHDSEAHHRALQLGAMGLVFKEKTSEVLMGAIKRVRDGEMWFDRSIMGAVLNGFVRKSETLEEPETMKIAALTEREREVINHIGNGLKNKQIAAHLCISETTVRHHLTSIFSKLGTSDRLELLIYAYRHGLVIPPYTKTAHAPSSAIRQ